LPRCPATTQSRGNEPTGELDRGPRSSSVFRHDAPSGDSHTATAADQDRKFLQLVARMLAVQNSWRVVQGELGSPQGSIVSPVLANIFLDQVLDQWFMTVVRQHCRGYCALIRYADDSIAVFEFEDDARRFMRVLPKRLEKFGLRLNEAKTQLLPFGKRQAAGIQG